VLDLTGGELFVIGFVVIAVVSAPWWPRLGAAIATRLAGVPPDEPERPSTPPSGRSESRSGR
jgi:hypothetical protein